ncbi:L-ribulose-5-phosphate 3-epimerase [Streptomyces sp. YIM S03343]
MSTLLADPRVAVNPVGIYEKALPAGRPWPETLADAAAAGYEFVEISIDESDERLARLRWTPQQRRAFRAATQDTGIRVPTICLSAHRRFALGSADPQVRGKARDILRDALQLAVDLGVRVVQLAGYYVYYEPHRPDSRARYVDAVAQGTDWAAGLGVSLGIENVDGPDINSVSRALEVVREIDCPWLQLYPDIGNLAENQLDVVAELRLAEGRALGFHVKDVRVGEPRRVPFGGGIAPLGAAMRELARQGYAGSLLVEMWNDDAPDWRERCQEARRYLDGLVARAADEAGPAGEHTTGALTPETPETPVKPEAPEASEAPEKQGKKGKR